MMVSSNALKAIAALGCLAAASVAAPSPAEARVFVGVDVGVPFFYPPVVVAPPVAYPYAYPYAYPPPAPAAYAPAPAAAAPTWYYCDNPAGYYPNVQSCSVQWRPVQPPAK